MGGGRGGGRRARPGPRAAPLPVLVLFHDQVGAGGGTANPVTTAAATSQVRRRATRRRARVQAGSSSAAGRPSHPAITKSPTRVGASAPSCRTLVVWAEVVGDPGNVGVAGHHPNRDRVRCAGAEGQPSGGGVGDQ